MSEKDIYLVVADETDGFQLALRYAVNRARRDDRRLGILYVMDKEDFQHWGMIERKIHEEQRGRAEKILINAAESALAMKSDLPCLYLEEGGRFEKITEVIQQNSHIRRLILGADAHSNSPGPLISYFTGKGLHNLGVPLTLIPGNLKSEAIENMF